jgi:hypothetical protein
MNLDARTPGEQLFEEYLLSNGITSFEHEKEYLGISKRVDYTIHFPDIDCLCEVKDIDYIDIPPMGAYDPHDRIREKIDECRKKFQKYKSFKVPRCGVLYNNNAHLVHLDKESVMFGAMEGDVGWSFVMNLQTGEKLPDSEGLTFLRDGKMSNFKGRPQNTSISALITLREIRVGFIQLCRYIHDNKNIAVSQWPSINFDESETHPGVIVWENWGASVPLPRNLFQGPYDERWAITEQGIERIYAGDRVLYCEELEKR